MLDVPAIFRKLHPYFLICKMVIFTKVSCFAHFGHLDHLCHLMVTLESLGPYEQACSVLRHFRAYWLFQVIFHRPCGHCSSNRDHSKPLYDIIFLWVFCLLSLRPFSIRRARVSLFGVHWLGFCKTLEKMDNLVIKKKSTDWPCWLTPRGVHWDFR